MTAKHTPTPWQIQVTGGTTECVSGNGPGLWAVIEGPDYDTRRANAAFIVQACNAHDELVAALEEIERINSESTSDCRKRMGTRAGNSLVTARAALAKVRP